MKLPLFFIAIGLIVITGSCEKNENSNDNTTKNSEARLLSVTCSFGEGLIDTTAHSVILKAPESIDITQIIPHFEISDGSTIYPPSDVATDFSSPVTYTITSEDASSRYIFKVNVVKPVILFTVYDCSNWTPESYNVLQGGASIKVYTLDEESGVYSLYNTLITDENAEATLYGLSTVDYYLIVEKDNKSNIMDGYVLNGTYNTQEEVDNSVDPNASLGGYKFSDINGDAIINSDDKSNYQKIWQDYLSDDDIYLKDLFVAE